MKTHPPTAEFRLNLLIYLRMSGPRFRAAADDRQVVPTGQNTSQAANAAAANVNPLKARWSSRRHFPL